MRQVLFQIPIPIPNPWVRQVPIYGFGLMLVLALLLGTWIAGRRARKEGIAPEHVQDVAFYMVIAGIIGARIVFMIQYRQPIAHFFYFWEGGLVVYGALVGAALGFLLARYFILSRHGISSLKLADVIAPSMALGLCLGRVGCLLNGCCYGGVACPDCASIHFPAHSFAWRPLVENGYQAAAGFTLSPEGENGVTVGAVDASSPAARVAGLQAGDVLLQANERPIHRYVDLAGYLLNDPHWQQGKRDLQLTVRRDGKEIELPAFQPQTLGLYPTQVYESISMFLLFLLLLAYSPFRRHDGEVLLLLLTLYPIHRFLNEMLRNDTEPVVFGMTLSENGSLLLLLVAAVLWIWMLRKPAEYQPYKALAAA